MRRRGSPLPPDARESHRGGRHQPVVPSTRASEGPRRHQVTAWSPVRLPPHQVDRDALLGRGSVAAAVLTHPAVLLGGVSALLLQVAEPSVAEAVARHSSYRREFGPRLVRTLAITERIAFGAPAEREAARAELDGRHAPVRGRRRDGQPYSASEPRLVLWVHATLVHAALGVDEQWLHLLDAHGRQQLLEEMGRLGEAYGVAEGALPSRLDRFRDWFDAQLPGLSVGPEALDVLDSVTAAPLEDVWGWPGGLARRLGTPLLRAEAADMLPRSVREAYGLRLSSRDRRLLGAAKGAFRAVIRARSPRGQLRCGHPDAPSRLAARLTRCPVSQDRPTLLPGGE